MTVAPVTYKAVQDLRNDKDLRHERVKSTP